MRAISTCPSPQSPSVLLCGCCSGDDIVPTAIQTPTKRLLQWWKWQFSLSNGGVYYRRYNTALPSVEKTVKIPIFQFFLTSSFNVDQSCCSGQPGLRTHWRSSSMFGFHCVLTTGFHLLFHCHKLSRGDVESLARASRLYRI